MFLWFPPPTKASWHNARESAESCGTIHLEINFSSKVLLKVGLHEKGHLCRVPHSRKSYLLHIMDTDILEKWERKPYLLHITDTDILVKGKKVMDTDILGKCVTYGTLVAIR